ncbi:flippase, partial [Salmonella enterica]|nr:flippase [Salmonella enterica]
HAGIPMLILSTIGVQYLSGLSLTILLIYKKLITLNKIRINVKKETPYLISNGFFFFILQMGTLATWSGDNFIISTTLGVTYVSILSITQRLFQISTVPLTIYNAPLWAAYADAHARNDVDFIRKTLLGSLKIVGISSTTLALILVIFGQSIIAIWTGEELRVPQSLIVAYAVWSIIDAYSNTLSSFLNGLNIIKQQVFAVVTLILISIPSKYFIVSHFGLTAMLSCFIIL